MREVALYPRIWTRGTHTPFARVYIHLQTSAVCASASGRQWSSMHGSSDPMSLPLEARTQARQLQQVCQTGLLAHKKHPPPRTLRKDYA
jgi:hypothetical protein